MSSLGAYSTWPTPRSGALLTTVAFGGALTSGVLLALLPDALLPYYLGSILFAMTTVACILRPAWLLYFVIVTSSLSDLFSITGSLGGVSLSGVRWVFVAALTGIVLLTRGHALTVPRIFLPMGLFVGWAVLRFALSPSGMLGLKDLTLYAMPFFVGTFTFVVRRQPGLLTDRTVARVAFISLALPVVLLVILTLAGWVEYTRLGPRGLVSGRATAAYLAVMSAVPLATARYGATQRERWGATVIALLAVLAILLTLSRAASAVAIGILLVSRMRPGRFVRSAVSAMVAVMVIGALFWQVPSFRDRNFFRSTQISGVSDGLNRFNTSGRDVMWPLVYEHALERPILGWGPGNARVTLARLGSDKWIADERHPHNEYLQVLNDVGLVGLVMLLFAWGVILRRLYRSWRSAEERADRSGAWSSQTALLACLAVLVLAITGNTFHYAFLTAPCFVLVGLWAGGEGTDQPGEVLESAPVRDHI